MLHPELFPFLGTLPLQGEVDVPSPILNREHERGGVHFADIVKAYKEGLAEYIRIALLILGQLFIKAKRERAHSYEREEGNTKVYNSPLY